MRVCIAKSYWECEIVEVVSVTFYDNYFQNTPHIIIVTENFNDNQIVPSRFAKYKITYVYEPIKGNFRAYRDELLEKGYADFSDTLRFQVERIE